jgi:H+/Cl- antiporter ClcA
MDQILEKFAKMTLNVDGDGTIFNMNFDFKTIKWNPIRNHQLTKAIPYWIAAITVGIVSSGYAQLFRYISNVASLLFQENSWLIFFVAPAAFFVGWFLVRRLAPAASGSGIPQILTAIDLHPHNDSPTIKRLLGLKIACIKIISSIFCLFGGGAIGREGPTLQISASIFHFVGSRARKIWPETDHHSWLIAGGAAGIASAFNTPLGGIVYAIEELSSSHFRKFQMAALSAVIISGVIAQAILGPYLYLGYPIIGAISLTILPVAILVGALSGVLGSFFGTALFVGSNFIKTRIAPNKIFLIPILCGFVLATLYYFADTRAIGPGSEINSDLLSGNANHSSILLIFVRFLSSAISYFSGCAGGIFAPSLAIGASLGAEIAKIFAVGHENLLILLGMIGFLTAVTHCPFTSLVLVMEMTDRHSAIFPMMVSALTAQAIAKSISSKSFYEKAKAFYAETERQ